MHHIRIAVPSMGALTPQLSAFLSQAKERNHDPKSDYRFTVRHVDGIRPVTYARNVIIDDFLTSDADRLWMIDSDVIPAGNAMDLLDVKADIAIGLVPLFGTFTDVPEPEFHWGIYEKKDDGFIPAQVGESIVRPCAAAASAMMLIRRRVLENDAMRFLEEHDPETGKRLVGSDIRFTDMATRLGYSLKAHHGVKNDHRKSIPLSEIMAWGKKVYVAGYQAAEREHAA